MLVLLGKKWLIIPEVCNAMYCQLSWTTRIQASSLASQPEGQPASLPCLCHLLLLEYRKARQTTQKASTEKYASFRIPLTTERLRDYSLLLTINVFIYSVSGRGVWCPLHTFHFRGHLNLEQQCDKSKNEVKRNIAKRVLGIAKKCREFLMY